MAGVTGADRLLADLSKLEGVAGNLRPVWPKLTAMWAARERRVFAGGAKWAPFSAATLVRHERTGKPPMVASGSLVAALTRDEPRFASDQMLVLGPPKSERKASATGTRHARGTVFMPARRVVPNLLASERRRMVEAIRDHLRKGL